MASNFTTNSTVTYNIAVDGTTTVTHDITLKNDTSGFFATSYTLSLNDITPINPQAFEGGLPLPVKITKEGHSTSIRIDFPDEVVGKDVKRNFSVVFSDKTLVTKTGEIWEITTPKLASADSFDFYSTILKIPKSFGNVAYISPNPSFKGQEGNQMILSFDKSASLSTTISAAFGNFQVFSFNITYHLENPLNETALTAVALPPDTSYQKVNYTKISRLPEKIEVDKDGNWLATIQLKAHEKLDLKVEGAVQIFPSPSQYPKTNYSDVTSDLKPSSFWQTGDPAIKSLASSLKTPKAIYDYVTSHLSYDYSRVAPDVQRLGAVKALQNPKNAICTEFTDLFITIARAAGIPAREIEGFAYTDNPKIQPLSLVADVLHSWPEYWDTNTQTWVPIDPTWGATSGINYFDKLDLKHFTFVVHGQDPQKPFPAGSYKSENSPQKDVQITFGQIPSEREVNLQIKNNVISQLPFSDEIVDTKITNLGPTAIYNQDIEFQFDNSKAITQKAQIIPPFGFYETKINIPYSFLGQKTPSMVEVLVAGKKKSEFTTYKTFVTISNLLMMCLFVFFAVSMIYLKFKDVKKSSRSNT